MTSLPTPIFVGFFPKHTERRPEGFAFPEVEEICSASACISQGPEDWVERWTHNTLGFFDTEALALDATEGDARAFDLYAFKVFPLQFHLGDSQAWEVPVCLPEFPAGYAFLGYDAVSRSAGSFLECSPLSCNYAAKEFAVNRHCLFDDLEEALAATKAISAGNYEPGPYVLCEVYRKAAAEGISS